MAADRPLLFFTHVLKAGGTSVEAALRMALGIRHMAVNPPTGWIYGFDDFRFDRRLNPLAVSYSSHWLRPFVDFRHYESRIVWHTMLREPIDRFRSHRQHHIERFGNRDSFDAWAAYPVLRNWQTRQLAGEEDLEAALQILDERYRFVGLLERFDESLILIRDRLDVPGIQIESGAVHNPARSRQTREQIEGEFERYRERVRELNDLDLRLYAHVRDDLFPRQVATFGAERLEREVARARLRSPSLPARVRARTNLLFRKVVQIPVHRRRVRAAGRSGRPDIRR